MDFGSTWTKRKMTSINYVRLGDRCHLRVTINKTENNESSKMYSGITWTKQKKTSLTSALVAMAPPNKGRHKSTTDKKKCAPDDTETSAKINVTDENESQRQHRPFLVSACTTGLQNEFWLHVAQSSARPSHRRKMRLKSQGAWQKRAMLP